MFSDILIVVVFPTVYSVSMDHVQWATENGSIPKPFPTVTYVKLLDPTQTSSWESLLQ